VKNFFNHELTKLLLYIILSFTLAAIISPHLYTAGKNLAASHAPLPKDPIFLESPTIWLAEKCDSAKFTRYFKRALMASALLLLYPLILSLRKKGLKNIPSTTPGLRINPRAQGWKDIAFGITISASLLFLLATLLINLEWVKTDEPLKLAKAFRKAIFPAIFASIIEEWLFRGVLYDILNRRLSAAKTIITLSFIFAALHFLTPPDKSSVTDPSHSLAGFQMLSLIGQKFLNPTSFLGVFLTLFAVGLILAYARRRTGYLWLSIGLHTGWIFAFKAFNVLTDSTNKANPILFNQSINEGLLPLITLIITAIAVHLYLKPKNKLKISF